MSCGVTQTINPVYELDTPSTEGPIKSISVYVHSLVLVTPLISELSQT
jgi:hypothetical protein